MAMLPKRAQKAEGSTGSSTGDRLYWAASTADGRSTGSKAPGQLTSPMAFSNSWEATCIQRISYAAQARVVFRDKKTKVEIEEHPWLDRLNDPNPLDLTITGFENWEETYIWLEVAGVAYWLLDKASGINPPPISVVNPNLVTVIPDPVRRIGGYKIGDPGHEVLYPPEQVVHFKTFSPYSKSVGLPPQMTLRQALLNFDAALRYNYAFFKNGGAFGAVIEVDDTLTDPEYMRMQDRLRTLHGGVDQAQGIPILERGMKWRQANITAKDGEFVEEMRQDRNAILGLHGVPSVMAGISEDSNFASAEKEIDLFWNSTIPFRQHRIREVLQKRIRFETGNQNIEVEFDNSQIPILKPDLKDVSRWLIGFLRFGSITPQESRKILNKLDVLPIVLDESIGTSEVVPITETKSVAP